MKAPERAKVLMTAEAMDTADLIGPMGPPGADGAEGPQGPQGIQGLPGADGGLVPHRDRLTLIETDFLYNGTLQIPGMLGAALSSGTCAVVAGEANHPGIVSLSDSTTANGGYNFATAMNAILLSGGEKAVFVFKPVSLRAAASFRLGWMDSVAVQTSPTDGVFFKSIANGTAITIIGMCVSNAVSGSTPAYTLTANTWYRGEIEINDAGTLVTFTIYSEAGAQLWQQTLAANIPTGAGRQTGFAVMAGETSTDAAAVIVQLDYLSMFKNKTLVR